MRRSKREHHWTEAHLSDYLDGDLAAAERSRLESHAGICPDCKRVLATLRRTVEALRALDSPAPRIADRVIASLRLVE